MSKRDRGAFVTRFGREVLRGSRLKRSRWARS